MKTVFEKFTEKFHTTPEKVHMEKQKAIDTGFEKVQEECHKMKIAGERLTPEEVIN